MVDAHLLTKLFRSFRDCPQRQGGRGEGKRPEQGIRVRPPAIRNQPLACHQLSFSHLLFGAVKRFVSFDTAASAEAAIQSLNNVAVGGRRLKVITSPPLIAALKSPGLIYGSLIYCTTICGRLNAREAKKTGLISSSIEC